MMRVSEKRKQKIIALMLAGVFLVSSCGGMLPSGKVLAAEPKVSTDEAVYVNLDYYGRMTDVSIVKGCNLNGATKFTDYGAYESVVNMSGYEKPVLDADGVHWDLGDKEKPASRFYYNCKVKNDTLQLPWTFDVSYKLNGVPCKADALAGAAGLVEIKITAKPNPKAPEYYRNNLLLQVATVINTEDNCSIEAPGAQLQSLGTYKGVLFAALPGEEKTFTIRVGTDCFETSGLMMMMIPGTLEQMKQIKELKEAKDTIKDSGEAIYDSLNELLTVMTGMRNGLEELKSGTVGMEDARSTLSAGKDQLSAYGDTVLKDLASLNLQLKKIIPHFTTAQEMTRKLNQKLEEVVEALDDMADPIDDTGNYLYRMKRDLLALREMLTKMSGQLETTLTSLGTMAATMPGMVTPYDAARLQGEGQLALILEEYMSNINSLLSKMAYLGETADDLADSAEELIDETDDLYNALDLYEDDIITIFADCQELTKLLSENIDSTVVYLSYAKALLRAGGDKLDAAAESSLRGLLHVLDQSLLGLESITTLREANESIKQTWDEEIEKIEEENRFLYLDAEAALRSFTSPKNPAPESVQIIFRTEEISLDNTAEGEQAGAAQDGHDLEVAENDIGLKGRLIQLWKRICAFFSR